MTVKDIFMLRKQGQIEEAYNAIRPLYAVDKGPYTSLAMFWTASDILKKRVSEGKTDEAKMLNIQNMYKEMIEIPEIRKYFDAELKFNVLIGDVNRIIAESVKDLI